LKNYGKMNMDEEDEQSDCDSDEHSEHSLGYHVQLDNEQIDKKTLLTSVCGVN